MSNRKDFLRNCLLAIAATLVPRVLQPILPDVESVGIVERGLPVNPSYEIPEVGTWYVYKYDRDSYIQCKLEKDANGKIQFVEV